MGEQNIYTERDRADGRSGKKVDAGTIQDFFHRAYDMIALLNGVNPFDIILYKQSPLPTTTPTEEEPEIDVLVYQEMTSTILI